MSSDVDNLENNWTQRWHEQGHYKQSVNMRCEAVVTICFYQGEPQGAVFLFHNELERPLVLSVCFFCLPPG